VARMARAAGTRRRGVLDYIDLQDIGNVRLSPVYSSGLFVPGLFKRRTHKFAGRSVGSGGDELGDGIHSDETTVSMSNLSSLVALVTSKYLGCLGARRSKTRDEPCLCSTITALQRPNAIRHL
jgi:hypothetical protein